MSAYDPRTPARRHGPLDAASKRTSRLAMGVLGASLIGGYGLMSAGWRSCTRPPEAGSPEALAMDPVKLAQMQQDYEQCRRRRTSSSTSRSGRSFFSSSSSSRSSVSRGGFGRSGGSFGG